jgi:uncharacterized membrane protein
MEENMGNKEKTSAKSKKTGSNKTNIIIVVTAIILSIAAIFALNNNKGGSASAIPEGNDIVINKSEITDKVKFIPTKVGKINMEIMAVKASDGTIRTAFNTCQVCNGSPRAYYKQEGDVVVCQNCGNRFSMDMIEQQRGGCNPVPIMKGDKTENNDTITISKDFIAQNKALFTEDWRTQ